MSKATFYEHFANKEECLGRALRVRLGVARRGARRGVARRRAPLRGAPQRRPARDPRGDRGQPADGAGDPRRDRRRRPAPRRAADRRAQRLRAGHVRADRARRRADAADPPTPRPTRRSRSSARRSSSSRASCARASPSASPTCSRSSSGSSSGCSCSRRTLLERPRRAVAGAGRAPGAPRAARSRDRRLLRVPAARRVARARRAREARGVRRPGVLGPADPRLRRSRRRRAILGLAPAAHGANRTGRVFTGDRSGDFLFAALHRTGFANQPTSVHAGDGLRLHDAWITAAVRCAPPANKPTPAERDTVPALRAARARAAGRRARHRLPRRVRVGRRAAPARGGGIAVPRPRPRFGHGAELALGPPAPVLLGTFHPSQQNTFTGKLTAPMIDAVLARARQLADCGQPRSATAHRT